MRFFIIFLICKNLLNCYTSKNNGNDIYLLLTLIQSPPIQIHLIGDSLGKLSDGFTLSKKLNNTYQINNFSVNGRTIRSWVYNISICFEVQPDIIIIELGTNDAIYESQEVVIEQMRLLLGEIEFRANVPILITLNPRTNDLTIQEKMSFINNEYRKLGSRYYFSDMETMFINKINEGQLIYSDINTDKLHPNPIGYEFMGQKYVEDLAKIGL